MIHLQIMNWIRHLPYKKVKCMRKTFLYIGVLLLTIIVFGGCKKSDETQKSASIAKGLDYSSSDEVRTQRGEKLSDSNADNRSSIRRLTLEHEESLARINMQRERELKNIELKREEMMLRYKELEKENRHKRALQIEREKERRKALEYEAKKDFYRNITVTVLLILLIFAILFYLIFNRKKELQSKIEKEKILQEERLVRSRLEHEKAIKILEIIADENTDTHLKRDMALMLMKKRDKKQDIVLEYREPPQERRE